MGAHKRLFFFFHEFFNHVVLESKNVNSKFSVSNSSNSSCMSDQSPQLSLLDLPNPGLLEKNA